MLKMIQEENYLMDLMTHFTDQEPNNRFKTKLKLNIVTTLRISSYFLELQTKNWLKVKLLFIYVEIAHHLGTNLGSAKVGRFTDGEVNI
jgi:hypothetical protein